MSQRTLEPIKSRWSKTPRVIPLVLASLLACDPIASFMTEPSVQDSAEVAPRWTVDLNRVVNGRYAAYRPRCLEIRVGHTIEFRNFLPDIATNVTGVESPAPLYSPNLVRPYNYVGPADPDNELCTNEERAAGICPPYSFWRHTFEVPGTYDWIDTNQGQGGRRVVDPYYGTVTFVGVDPDAPASTVCVIGDDPAGCEGVCCSSDADCSLGTTCQRGELEAVGRCLTL